MAALAERDLDPAKFKAADPDAKPGMILTGDPEWDAMEYARFDPANQAG